MEVDVQIAFRMQGYVDQAVPSELFEHVIEKADARRNLCGAAAVEIHSAGDPGFLGVAFDRRHSHDALLQGPRPRHTLVTTFASTFHWGHPHRGIPRLTPTPPNLHLSFPGRAYALIFREFPYAASDAGRGMDYSGDSGWHGTTILCLRKGGQVVVAGDGQVTMGQTVVKSNARKLRRLAGGSVIAGFAGATADAITLFERLEGKLEQYSGQLSRACVELAKDWRTDRYLRRLEAMMAVADKNVSLILSGTGDVLEPEDAIIGIGSGGGYALAAARALIGIDSMDAEEIVRRAMAIAAGICIYTNDKLTLEKLEY